MLHDRSRHPRIPAFCPVLIAVFVLALVAAVPAAAGPQEAIELMQQGIAKLQEGDIEGGLQDLQRAIEIDPEQAQAHFFAGQASAQLERWQQAYDYFVAATELAPGYGDAHMQACRVAYTLEKYDESWEHAIRAAQAGIDMQSAFEGLEARSPVPEDLPRRLEAPRVLIGAVDTTAVAAQGGALPGDSAGSDAGVTLLAELGPELAEVRRWFGTELQRSEAFGVVMSAELATWVLVIRVDSIEDSRSLRGFVKLVDPTTEEEVYSRVLILDNVRSSSDVRNDIGRYVGYMEEWLAERNR